MRKYEMVKLKLWHILLVIINNYESEHKSKILDLLVKDLNHNTI